MRSLKNRAGFVLPMVIVFLIVMSFALAAGLAATAAETGTATAQRGQNRAYTVSEQGLQRFVTSRDSLYAVPGCECLPHPTAAQSGKDSVNVGMAGPRPVVVARMVRPQQRTKDTITALFFVRATGIDSTSRMRGKGTTTAVRSVGLMVQWSTQTMNVTGAWTSLSGLNKSGSAGQIDGNDACGRKPAVAGILVPKGDYTASGGFTPTGNPPLDTTKTLAQLEQQTTIDWNGIINGNSMPYDVEVPPQAFPTAAWFAADTSRWPIIRVHTNGFVLPN